MRYRALTPTGDYRFGRGSADFLVNSAACVGQSVLTRLRLWQGEWFINTASGTAWLQSVLGKNTIPLYDIVLRQRILDTEGVVSLVDYQSNLDRATRALTVSAKLNTAFGETTIATVLQVR